MATATQADIERIVQEVMAQLKAAAVPAAAAPAAAPPADLPKHNSELFIDSRVVTLQSIAGRLNGARQLVVTPGAIVTPSVRDELRRRGIEFVRQNPSKKASLLAPVFLIASRAGHDPELAVQMLRQEGIDVWTDSTNCLVDAAGKLAAAIAARSLAVLWTRHTAVGLCLSNRRAGVRAVLATSVPATAAALAAVGANVLVIDPTAGTLYEKKQVLRDFCLGGIRPCPEELKKVLDLGT